MFLLIIISLQLVCQSFIYNTYFYYIILGQLVFGLLVGAIPLILGVKRGKRNLGIISFFVCVIGAVLPLLCVLLAVIFSIVIIVKSGAKEPAESEEAASTESSE